MGFARLAWLARRRGVRTSSIWGSSVVQDEWGARLFEDFLEPALASGRFQAAPEPLVAGVGLETIPTAMQRLAQGVSARKVVVSLPDRADGVAAAKPVDAPSQRPSTD